MQRGRAARHLEPDVEALRHAELALRVRDRALADVERVRDADAARQLEPVGVHVGDDDVPRARVAHDGGRHDADRPGAGDQHVLAEHGEGERRVHGVAEGIEDRGDVEVDARRVLPDVRHRQRDALGERAGAVDADALGVGAEVPAARHAVAAAAAHEVPLAADDVARREVVHVRARSRRPRRRTRARRPSAPGSSAAPRRPRRGCAGRCRRCRCAARGSARR